MDKDKYVYAFDLNQHYDVENSYATLPPSTNHQRASAESNQHFQVHHYEPKGPPSINSHPSSHHNSQDLVSIFTDLAHSVNVKLNEELTKNLLTLIRLGVPPDDIYIFLRDCVNVDSRSSRV